MQHRGTGLTIRKEQNPITGKEQVVINLSGNSYSVLRADKRSLRSLSVFLREAADELEDTIQLQLNRN